MADIPSGPSKHPKPDHEDKVADPKEKKDRISVLPDDDLCQILSWIPTKYSVATSVLSKRWRNLWISVPNLEFDGLFGPGNSVNSTSYLNFENRVLSQHNSSLCRNFHLRSDQDWAVPRQPRVEQWINAATRARDVKDLVLGFPRSNLVMNIDQSMRLGPNLMLPISFFNRQNLVSLHLRNMALTRVPASVVSFPNLCTIKFDSVQFLDDDSLKNLISGCPALKRLSITRETWDNAEILYISSSTLDYLALITFKAVNKNLGYKVVIEAPSLTRLLLCDHADIDYVMNNISSLEELFVSVERNNAVVPDLAVYTNKLSELLRNISHIKELHLSLEAITSLVDTRLYENLPMFNLLNHLELQFDDFWPILPSILKSSPNLVTLVLNINYDDPVDHSKLNFEWFTMESVPNCLSACLENIKIAEFVECEAMFELIKYFLKNAMVLKEISIRSENPDWSTRSIAIREKLLAFPRRATACQIIFF